MAKAVALSRTLAPHAPEVLRISVVAFCATALIAAGQVLPL